jgi:PUA-domain protein
VKRTQVKSKDINEELIYYHLGLNKKDCVEIVENGMKVLLINKQPAFFYYKNKPVPTLHYLQKHPLLKSITVDMGAVKFVVNGADIMRPGITHIAANIRENDFVMIIDENNRKPLAVGVSLLNSEDLQRASSGKHVKNIHYVGDDLWNEKY